MCATALCSPMGMKIRTSVSTCITPHRHTYAPTRCPVLQESCRYSTVKRTRNVCRLLNRRYCCPQRKVIYTSLMQDKHCIAVSSVLQSRWAAMPTRGLPLDTYLELLTILPRTSLCHPPSHRHHKLGFLMNGYYFHLKNNCKTQMIYAGGQKVNA